ncbi:MAG: hypothetical protein QOE11_2480 [Solirubrobacteraceae bacterium]|jgi:hypothetical protein|nr:hypothetical protein [Solirubrobacteraceae bacterium]
MTHLPRGTARTIPAFAAIVAVLALVALAGASPADASTCNTQGTAYYLPSGNGYITSLSVTNVSCKSGRKLALAFYRCRHKKGKAGKCTDKVLGYSCKEAKRLTTQTPPEINARVRCTRGARTVTHTYQQNL